MELVRDTVDSVAKDADGPTRNAHVSRAVLYQKGVV